MDIKIHAKNIELTSHAEEYIHKKFRRIERHIRELDDAKLELERTSARSQADSVNAQITLVAGSHVLRGQKRGLNLFAAIDAVADVIDQQIRRYKGQVYRSARGRRAGRSQPGIEGPSDAIADPAVLRDIETGAPEVVRRKRFSMQPMTVEDAIERIELLDHSFFFFRNKDSDQYNVLYRRHDDSYGLIEPELD